MMNHKNLNDTKQMQHSMNLMGDMERTKMHNRKIAMGGQMTPKRKMGNQRKG